LLNVAGEAVLINTPSGLTVLGEGPPDEARLLAGLRVEVRPSDQSRPLLFDETGIVYRWAPGWTPRKIWPTGTTPQNLEVIGLSGDRILLQRPATPGSSEWTTEMIDTEIGIMWQQPGDLRGVLPWNESVLAIAADRASVIRLRLADGAPAWKCALDDRAAALTAIVGGKLWLRTYAGQLIGLDVDTGRVSERLSIPLAAVPEGVVDQQGLLHLCTGPSYTIIDLQDGSTVFTGVLPAGDDAPSAVFGSLATPLNDGRLLFFDRVGRVYTLRAGDRSNLIWQSASPLIDCCVAHETVFILNRKGELSALRPS
jgi:outer membrane protein assembly factor BamB